MYKKILIVLCATLLVTTGCSSKKTKHGLRVAATPVPQAEMLEFVKPLLKEKGIDLVVIVTDDYNMPNRALANHEIEANFFQHQPFLDEQIKQFHYPLVSIAKIEIEPMGVYSRKIRLLSELKENAVIAIPNDPTNEARALLLLQAHGVIKLDSQNILQATVLNISSNPKNIKFIEADAAMLPRTLQDVDAAVINTNYALQADLSPTKDAIAIESRESPYANILVIRIDEETSEEILELKNAMTSDKMRDFIREKYKGAVLPAF